MRIDWFDLLAVQGTLKNLLQHHSSKASVLPDLLRSIIFYLHVSQQFAKNEEPKMNIFKKLYDFFFILTILGNKI